MLAKRHTVLERYRLACRVAKGECRSALAERAGVSKKCITGYYETIVELKVEVERIGAYHITLIHVYMVILVASRVRRCFVPRS
jgi:hypothetical protein